MEGANCAFFSATWAFGWRITVLSLVEYPALGWRARQNYLEARTDERAIEIYGMDLVYLLASRQYEGVERPSDIYYDRRIKDTRSARKIIEETVQKLTG